MRTEHLPVWYPFARRPSGRHLINTIMATTIGISTKIKDAFNMIDHEGVSPVVSYHNKLYVLSTKGRDTGSVYYTVFVNSTTPQYSVLMPFSFADYVGQIFDKGDNLRPHIDPVITELPPQGIGMLYSSQGMTDLLRSMDPPKTIVKRD